MKSKSFKVLKENAADCQLAMCAGTTAISDATYIKWRRSYGGRKISTPALKALRTRNLRRKRLLREKVAPPPPPPHARRIDAAGDASRKKLLERWLCGGAGKPGPPAPRE